MPNLKLPSTLRIALVYDWATTPYGGAEWLLSVLLRAFPTAALFTTIAAPSLSWIAQSRVRTSFLQHRPSRNHRLLVPLMPLAVEALDLSEFDIILSVSTGIALGILTKPNQLHLCYLLSPPRYIYRFDETYTANEHWINWFPLKQGIRVTRKYLTKWQNQACLRPDSIVPLSYKIKKQAEVLYHRPLLEPIYPPVPNKRTLIQPKAVAELSQTKFWLYVGRLVGYKQPQLCIQAALQAKHRLILLGSGPLFSQLRAAAGDTGVEFSLLSDVMRWLQVAPGLLKPKLIGFWQQASDVDTSQLMAAATVIISPGVDDFGLVPLESVTLGTPSVFHQESGVAEVLKSGIDGVSVNTHTVATLLQSIRQAEQITISPKHSLQLWNQFSASNFVAALTAQLATNWYTRTHLNVKYNTKGK